MTGLSLFPQMFGDRIVRVLGEFVPIEEIKSAELSDFSGNFEMAFHDRCAFKHKAIMLRSPLSVFMGCGTETKAPKDVLDADRKFVDWAKEIICALDKKQTGAMQ